MRLRDSGAGLANVSHTALRVEAGVGRQHIATYLGLPNYTNNWLRNNSDGDFWVPPTGNLDDEWGIASGDIRHRVILQASSQFLRNFTTSWNLNMSSGAPYTLQTGRDDNGDLIFNDRPLGVGRNTQRAKAQMSLNALFG